MNLSRGAVAVAGYYIYSIDPEVFKQLTTEPTPEQAQILADQILDDSEIAAESIFNLERDPLAAAIQERLASDDWYSDLSYADGLVWESIIELIRESASESLGIELHTDTDFDSVYWDVCEQAVKHGAKAMAEPNFGNSGFRFFGKPTNEHNPFPMHSIHTPEETKELYKQLRSVQHQFGDDVDLDTSEEFHEALLLPVQIAAENGRYLWVQTDT